VPAPGQKTPPRALQKKIPANISKIRIPDPKPSLAAEIHDLHLCQKSATATRAGYLYPTQSQKKHILDETLKQLSKDISGIAQHIQFTRA
jgi:hypothetical protein